MIYSIVLAAGKGTRMKTELPKCAFPLLKKPMISYILESLKSSMVEKNIVILGHKKEYFSDLLDDCLIAYQNEQLGTAHAVKMGLELLNEGITIILPGDAPLISSEIIDGLINEHIKNKNELTVGAMVVNNPFGYGRIIMKDDSFVGIVEEKEATEEQKQINVCNSGLMVVNNDVLKKAISQVKNDNSKHEYYLTDIVYYIERKGISLIKNVELLTGVNDLYTLSCLEEFLRDSINRKHMYNGVNIINQSSVIIGPDVKIGKGTVIMPNTVITGNTEIGENSIIGPSSELHNAVIMNNATVKHSVVYDSKVCDNATVGPFAHLRMNTIVGENDRIGNFVEIKKSTLGSNTNAAHLTYMGDSIIGSHVNMGCGVITVNYDGKNKNKTIIGDNVFVGCNSNLIAPVKIGDGAYIAAGSTITKDVPNDALAIARSNQTNKEDYAKKYKK